MVSESRVRILGLSLALLALGCGRDTPTAPSRPSVALQGHTVLNTGPVPCDRANRQQLWRTPTRIRLTETVLWVGTDFGFRGDLPAAVVRLSDGTDLVRGSVDRYRDPASDVEESIRQTYYPDFVELAAGDGLLLMWECHPLVEGAWRAHYVVTIYYTTEGT